MRSSPVPTGDGETGLAEVRMPEGYGVPNPSSIEARPRVLAKETLAVLRRRVKQREGEERPADPALLGTGPPGLGHNTTP